MPPNSTISFWKELMLDAWSSSSERYWNDTTYSGSSSASSNTNHPLFFGFGPRETYTLSWSGKSAACTCSCSPSTISRWFPRNALVMTSCPWQSDSARPSVRLSRGAPLG